MDALTSADFEAFSGLASAAGRVMAPALVELDGITYAATVPQVRRAAVLIEGGTKDQGELSVRVARADLPAKPAENGRLRWRRTEAAPWSSWWIILTVSESPLDTEYALSCVPAN